MKNKISNTTEMVKENPMLGFINSLNIEAQEASGQRQLTSSSQLPTNADGLAVKAQYEKMGIKVLKESEGDNLFFDVILPEGWEIKASEHSMWSNLIDNKGRIRANIFYKAAFYDRNANIQFLRRFNFEIHKFLPQEKTGSYEPVKVKKQKPFVQFEVDEFGNIRNDFYCEEEKQNEVEMVWKPKYKNHYTQIKNTPHYYQITDCKKVIFTTEDKPLFFKKRYVKDKDGSYTKHHKWWKKYDYFENQLVEQAKIFLYNNYPNWNDINEYWD